MGRYQFDWKGIREWMTLVIAIIGAITGAISLIATDRQSSTVRDLQVTQKLWEAWDAMGGKKGSLLIEDIETDPNALEISRRLIYEALTLDPDSASARHHNAVYLSAIGDNAASIKEFKAAIRLDRQSMRSYISLGRELIKANKPAEALEVLNTGLQVDHGNSVLKSALNTNRGIALSRLGNSDEAISAFKCALEVNPQYSLALISLGHVYMDKKDYDNAEKAYRQANRLGNKNAQRAIEQLERAQAFEDILQEEIKKD